MHFHATYHLHEKRRKKRKEKQEKEKENREHQLHCVSQQAAPRRTERRGGLPDARDLLRRPRADLERVAPRGGHGVRLRVPGLSRGSPHDSTERLRERNSFPSYLHPTGTFPISLFSTSSFFSKYRIFSLGFPHCTAQEERKHSRPTITSGSE